jgi:hypothetical protein
MNCCQRFKNSRLDRRTDILSILFNLELGMRHVGLMALSEWLSLSDINSIAHQDLHLLVVDASAPAQLSLFTLHHVSCERGHQQRLTVTNATQQTKALSHIAGDSRPK